MKKEKSQRMEILEHLKRNGSITSKEAFELYGVTRLAAVISILRGWGSIIETSMAQTRTRYGTTAKYAVYKYVGEVKTNG